MRNDRWKRGLLPLAVLAALLFAGCGGGGASPGGEARPGPGNLVLIDSNVGGTDGVALNQILVFEFSQEVVGSSVSPETMRIRLAPATAKQVPGDYNVSGNIVEFYPRLPNLPDLSDSGLAPGRTYEANLPGQSHPNCLVSGTGDRLFKTYKATFATAIASSPNLFIDYDPDQAPHVVSVNPKPFAIGVPQAITVEFTFSEPLLPSTVTTSNLSLTLVERPPGNVLSPARPIPGQVLLEQSRQSVIVRFVPDFPLADNAKYTLEVDRRVQDLVGNDLDPYYSEFTIRDEPPVPGEFVLDFGPGSEVYKDPKATIASWNIDIPGALAGIFTAGAGNGSDGDFRPTSTVTLNSTTKDVYQYKTFEVPAGVTVRLIGTKPVQLLSLQTMKIEGTIDASGYKGKDGDSNTSARSIQAKAGGAGGPGGGNGGAIATNAPSTSSLGSGYTGNQGDNGGDGYGTTGTGGKAAEWGNPYYYKFSSAGGGGGGHGTAGKAGGDGVYARYQPGIGGKGGGTGGNAALNPITAGGGGGAGQNMYYYYYPANIGGASGAGGGGAVTIGCSNNILIMGGEILANGGDGGASPSTYYMVGGPSGAGAGGAILVQSLKELICQGAKISAAGGKGFVQSYTYYKGNGGDGGDGRLLLKDADGSPALSGTTVAPSAYGKGIFTAFGPGTPSVGQTLWINLGIFDPRMNKPTASDIVKVLPNETDGQKIAVEVQMTQEDVFDLGNPDEDVASAWVDISQIETLNGNGYSYMRLRFTFTLGNNQQVDDPVPYLDRLRLTFTY